MTLTSLCLLALVAVVAAYAPPGLYTPPPPVRCYSDSLSRHFNIGQKWTEPGCKQAECVAGKLKLTQCPILVIDYVPPTSRCRQVDGPAGSQYPTCCPTTVCDQCYSETLDRIFDDGDVWTEKGCTQAICSKGAISGIGCSVFKLEAGCRLVDGPAGSQYPACCPTTVCDQCYSETLGRIFYDGDVWTEKGCTQATCSKGAITRLGCPTFKLKAGCRLVDGPAGSQYPACCPTTVCDQCYSEKLGRIFYDGDVWTESDCVQYTCQAGRRLVHQKCGVTAAKPGCVLKDGQAGGLFPACCRTEYCPPLPKTYRPYY